jgi:hypothetical protein
MDKITSNILRPSVAAAYLSLSVQRLAKLRLEGGGPQFIKCGRSVLYHFEDLDSWLAANRRKSTSDTGTRHAP